MEKKKLRKPSIPEIPGNRWLNLQGNKGYYLTGFSISRRMDTPNIRNNILSSTALYSRAIKIFSPSKHNILDRGIVYSLFQILWIQTSAPAHIPWTPLQNNRRHKISPFRTNTLFFPQPGRIGTGHSPYFDKYQSLHNLDLSGNTPDSSWLWYRPPTYLPKPIRFRPRSKLFQILGETQLKKRE